MRWRPALSYVSMCRRYLPPDGANDLTMLAISGLGVAFHAKPIVAREARARVDHADLRALLFAQGYPASAFVTP